MSIIQDALIAAGDVHRPSVVIPSLQGWDNYQIYSLISVDYPCVLTTVNNGLTSGQPYHFRRALDTPSTQSIGDYGVYLAVQTFSFNSIPTYFIDQVKELIGSFKPKNSSIYVKVNTISSPMVSIPIRWANEQHTAYYLDYLSQNPGYVAAVNLANLANADDSNQFSYVAGNEIYNHISNFGHSNYLVPANYTYHQDNYTVYGISVSPPDHICFAKGYMLDDRDIPDANPVITPDLSEDFTVSYYRWNRLESNPHLCTIDWFEYRLKAFKGVAITIPLDDVVFGSLSISSNSVRSKLAAIQTSGYEWEDYYTQNISIIWNHWVSLYNSQPIITSNCIVDLFNDTEFGKGQFTDYQNSVVRVLYANNNVWGNPPIIRENVNFDINHPMFKIDDQRAFSWHLKNLDNGIGDLTMDSPKVVQLWQLFNCGLYENDPITDEPPLVNLGWLIKKVAWILGIRPKSDALINQTEDKKIIRQVIPKDKKLDPEKVGVMSFGEEGMVLKRINNRFKKDQIVSDQCVIVPDLLSLIHEYFEQTNIALGVQESTAIEIKHEHGIVRFNNQLELMIEMLNLIMSQQEMVRSTLVSGLVTQSQSNEIIAGLGLPSVTKSIPIEIDKKIQHIPFKGIAGHRSISQEIATCAYNIGIVTGQLI